MDDLYFALRLHDELIFFTAATRWFEAHEKWKEAALYALFRLIFSNGLKREELISELRETFKYSPRSATRILNPLFKNSSVKRTPMVERQLDERGRPKKGGRPEKKRGRRPGVYEFEKVVPVKDLPKPSVAQIGPVCLYDRDLFVNLFKFVFTLHRSYREVIVKALTACGCKDIYESKLSDDDLIAIPRYGMGCLLLTFFKRCGDEICENWPEMERVLSARWNDFWDLNAQQAPNPAGNVQHSPRNPLAPTYPLDTGGTGTFVGPNGARDRLG